MLNLGDKICLVTGASRGIGRGAAIQLATYGATCYITGRSITTLKLVEEEVKSRSVPGNCIPIECDHSNDESVKKLFETISEKNNGQLDLLVNNAYAAVEFIMENSKYYFWDQPDNSWDIFNDVGLRNNYMCAVHAARLMVPHRKGLIINLSSSGGKMYLQVPQYGIGKAANDRMAKDCAMDSIKYNIAFISLWPGLVMTETIDAEWRKLHDGRTLTEEEMKYDLMQKTAESSEFSGRCIAYLLANINVMQKTGQIIITTDVALEFNFKDVNDKLPLSQRSIRYLLMHTPMRKIASFIPTWIRLLKFVYLMAVSVASAFIPRKLPSKHE